MRGTPYSTRPAKNYQIHVTLVLLQKRAQMMRIHGKGWWSSESSLKNTSQVTHWQDRSNPAKWCSLVVKKNIICQINHFELWNTCIHYRRLRLEHRDQWSAWAPTITNFRTVLTTGVNPTGSIEIGMRLIQSRTTSCKMKRSMTVTIMLLDHKNYSCQSRIIWTANCEPFLHPAGPSLTWNHTQSLWAILCIVDLTKRK